MKADVDVGGRSQMGRESPSKEGGKSGEEGAGGVVEREGGWNEECLFVYCCRTTVQLNSRQRPAREC